MDRIQANYTEECMMQRIQAALFDLDGTLTNTLQDIADAMNRALSLHGLPTWTTEEYKYLVGDGVRILAQRAVRDRQELADAVRRTYQDWYGSHSQVTTCPYAGVREMLAALSGRGIRLAVLSNKPHQDTARVVAHYFPDVAFDQVCGQREGVPVKPDPTGALAVAQPMGIPHEAFVYLGDTSVDMRCACRAGMHAVGVLWGFRPEAELWESGAEAVISRPMALMDLLRGEDNAFVPAQRKK